MSPLPRTGEPTSPARRGAAGPIILWSSCAAILLLLVLLAVRKVGTPDVGFHLRVGESILENREWPRVDALTYTLRGRPYVDMSWGYQALLASVHAVAGAHGMVALNLALILTVFGTLLATARLRPRSPSSLVVLFLAATLACESRFEVRPEWVSYGLLALTLYLLHRRATIGTAPLYLLPVIHLVWANVHSLFLLGWAVQLCFLAGALLERRGLDRPLLMWGGLSVVASLANPYGIQGALFPLTLATRFQEGNPFRATIGELFSPFGPELASPSVFYPWMSINIFRLLVLLSVPALVLWLWRRRFTLALLWLAALPLGIRMIRNIPVFVVVCLPLLVWAASWETPLSRWLGDRRARAVLTAVQLLAIAVAVSIGLRAVNGSFYTADRRPERFGTGWNELSFPVGAGEYLSQTEPSGRMFNHIGFGGYLAWRLREPVFIDGRLELVGEEFYGTYQRAISDPEAFGRLVARHDIGWVVVPYASDLDFTIRLYQDPRWTLTYRDHLAAIFETGADPGRHPVDPDGALPEEVDIAALPGLGSVPRPGFVARWLDGIVQRQELPVGDFNRGSFYYHLGDVHRARRHWAAAIDKSGGRYWEFYRNLGLALLATGETEPARRCVEIALAESPRDPLTREMWAILSSRHGRGDGSRR